jgi:hypothetical protein
MLTVKPTTFTSRLLERWNLAITEATNRRDKAALRVLSKILAATVDSLPGAERARALALVARADACLRYLNTWRGWRGERRWRLRHARRVMP